MASAAIGSTTSAPYCRDVIGHILPAVADIQPGEFQHFIERYLKAEGFKVTAADLRGNLPRKVQYFPSSGVARVKQIEDASAKTVFQRETAKKITAVQTQAGSIELFD